ELTPDVRQAADQLDTRIFFEVSSIGRVAVALQLAFELAQRLVGGLVPTALDLPGNTIPIQATTLANSSPLPTCPTNPRVLQ
ncbi:MAG: hypothetical protein ACI81P_002707, partial [Neolewinella sp.]